MTPAPSTPNCVIVGGGPAGLFAADQLAQQGASVTVYERKPSVARKFLMAGRGGLNITHSEPLDRLIARYGEAADRLGPIIGAFPPQSLRDYCAELGEETFVGSSGRVFPKSFKASPLLRALLGRLAANGVRIETRASFEGFAESGALLIADASGARREIAADAAILALGGASWPRLGADGGWVETLLAKGVEIAPLLPANCAVVIDWPADFAKAFEGTPLKTISLHHGEARSLGDIVVTRTGIEGGPVYALASALGRALARGEGATLHVDLRPSSTAEALAQRLARPREKQSMASFLRKTLRLTKLEIALLRFCGPLPQAPDALAERVKNLPLAIVATAGLERAISTAGGVRFAALDDDLMLKNLPGVFVAGEMLDFDAPTGGYLLQASFSSAFVAARGVAGRLGLAERK
ncbi:TIGR03862 family flavoprotein [Methylosinus sp. KRF6]|uniref:TIGR03862 family flavoprotein n=1 Tax=Methylosinus TaxID=425 RepID=UPI00163D4CFE|nr:TIGR03862 family flavoprotein [Methylosinus sporium]MBU3888237.1 TIGR03862 family flavoprotein [Methylosinus sp. KRF6]